MLSSVGYSGVIRTDIALDRDDLTTGGASLVSRDLLDGEIKFLIIELLSEVYFICHLKPLFDGVILKWALGEQGLRRCCQCV